MIQFTAKQQQSPKRFDAMTAVLPCSMRSITGNV